MQEIGQKHVSHDVQMYHCSLADTLSHNDVNEQSKILKEFSHFEKSHMLLLVKPFQHKPFSPCITFQLQGCLFFFHL